MRIFKPLAKAVAAETVAAITPAIDDLTQTVGDVSRTVGDMSVLVERIQGNLDLLLARAEVIEAHRPGWLATAKPSEVDQMWATLTSSPARPAPSKETL
ncbi:hypothetical protein ACGFYP_07470 [Streptomyces sp. NPDC048370]|uniref:hypothetical protein n=1 Tax=Streptomyces sp. NPDC048370 TaxID=3365540 RepID=UPI0037207474